jgi:hypothetical protein
MNVETKVEAGAPQETAPRERCVQVVARELRKGRCASRGGATASRLPRMDEDALNMSVRKYLKKLGVTSQREIETAVREQVAAGRLRGDESLDVSATVSVQGLTDVVVTGKISLA